MPGRQKWLGPCGEWSGQLAATVEARLEICRLSIVDQENSELQIASFDDTLLPRRSTDFGYALDVLRHVAIVGRLMTEYLDSR
jgi:hypothetical protein